MNLGSDNKQENGAPDDRKFANKAFNALNYLGLGWIANSSLSLWITYNLLPTRAAQKGIDGLQKTFVPISTAVDKAKGAVGLRTLKDKARAEVMKNNAHLSEEALEKMAAEVQKSHMLEHARSWAEILCMFIAGTTMIVPMKMMEDNKEWWVDKLDGLRHGKLNRSEDNPRLEDSHDKQTWGRLLKARVMGMAAVLGINSGMDVFNVARASKGKGNFDTAEWKMGAHLYDNMSDKNRERVVGFFSRKGVEIDSIQPALQRKVMDTVNKDTPELIKHTARLGELHDVAKERMKEYNAKHKAKQYELHEMLTDAESAERAAIRNKIANNPELKKATERAIFAEQTRLLSKEISLTLIMAGLVWAFSRAKPKPEKKGADKKQPDNVQQHLTHQDEKEDTLAKASNHAEKLQPRSKPEKADKLFAERIVADSAQPELQHGV